MGLDRVEARVGAIPTRRRQAELGHAQQRVAPDRDLDPHPPGDAPRAAQRRGHRRRPRHRGRGRRERLVGSDGDAGEPARRAADLDRRAPRPGRAADDPARHGRADRAARQLHRRARLVDRDAGVDAEREPGAPRPGDHAAPRDRAVLHERAGAARDAGPAERGVEPVARRRRRRARGDRLAPARHLDADRAAVGDRRDRGAHHERDRLGRGRAREIALGRDPPREHAARGRLGDVDRPRRGGGVEPHDHARRVRRREPRRRAERIDARAVVPRRVVDAAQLDVEVRHLAVDARRQLARPRRVVDDDHDAQRGALADLVRPRRRGRRDHDAGERGDHVGAARRHRPHSMRSRAWRARAPRPTGVGDRPAHVATKSPSRKRGAG